MKIAITSSDGAHIDTHFGKAKRFYIFQQDKDGKKVLEEIRLSEAYSTNDLTNHKFNKNKFSEIYHLISDCDALYTEKIGDVPRKEFQSKGIKVREKSGCIYCQSSCQEKAGS